MNGFLVWNTYVECLAFVARDIDEAEAYVELQWIKHPAYRFRIQRLEDGVPVDD